MRSNERANSASIGHECAPRTPIAVVTGAARGIGRRIAAHFVESGYFVVVTDIDENGARTCAEAIGVATRAERMDVRDPARVKVLFERIFADHGAIDVLINNAGRMTQGPFANTRHDELDVHSIINEASKPAWLKGLAVINMGLYRRFYRQKRKSFAGAGDGAICGASTFSTSPSIKCKHTEKRTAPQDSPRSPERALRLRQQCPQNF